MKEDIFFLFQAFRLAREWWGRTSPNPPVGALLVKGGKILGKGVHKGAGSPHAEVEAIRDALQKGLSPKGATLYVTLQPCNFWGRTPPCTREIEKFGISRVVWSSDDPKITSYKVNFKFSKKLSEIGESFYLPFLWSVKLKRPYIICKVAQTLDGKIADFQGNSKYITSERSRKIVHKLRSVCDFVVVGKNTVLKDNPRLDVRLLKKAYHNPVKVVLDSKAKILENKNLEIFKGQNTVIFTSKETQILQNLPENTSFLKVGTDVRKVVEFVQKVGGMTILVEGGDKVITSFLESGLCDELWIFTAPFLLGGAKSWFSQNGFPISNAKRLKVKVIGEEILVKASFHGKFWEFYPKLPRKGQI